MTVPVPAGTHETDWRELAQDLLILALRKLQAGDDAVPAATAALEALLADEGGLSATETGDLTQNADDLLGRTGASRAGT